MLRRNAMMDAVKPCLQVGEDQMDHGQEVLGDLWFAALGDGVVIVAALSQAGVGAPVVRDHQRSRLHRVLYEAAERLCGAVFGDGETNSSRIASVLALVLGSPRLAMT